MKKRIACLAAAGLLALTLTGCGVQAEQLETLEAPSSGIEQTTASPQDFEDNLEGLCKYMEANQAVVGERVEMSYKEIGAIGGFRYRFKFNGSTVQAEFYEFDLDNLNDKAQECLDSTREKGSFPLLGNDVPATLSGKYMMIYTDASKEQANTEKRDEAVDLLAAFHA